MGQSKIEHALRNWNDDVDSKDGLHSSTSDSPESVTARFIKQWHQQLTECIDTAACSAEFVRDELNGTGHSERTREMLLEVSRLQASLLQVRRQVDMISNAAARNQFA